MLKIIFYLLTKLKYYKKIMENNFIIIKLKIYFKNNNINFISSPNHPQTNGVIEEKKNQKNYKIRIFN